MSNVSIQNNLGLLLKSLLKERSLSMSKLSKLTGIDTATISRIINGKRKATPEHLKKFSESLEVPIADLFTAAGFPIEQNQENSDMHISVDKIQQILETSNVLDHKFKISDIEEQLMNYKKYVETEEGREYILKKFEDKLQKVGSIGPFIEQLKNMYEHFLIKKGTTFQLTLIGSALIYFILPVDVIPDYIFPIGYIDDAIAVQIITDLLK